MPTFVPGIELAHDYWFDVVAPILDPYLPRADRAAALLAEGSDVLGFDTEQSTDHGWGPKVFVFADGLNRPAHHALIDTVEARDHRHVSWVSDTLPTARRTATVRHQVLFTSVAEEFDRRLGCDPRTPMHASDWLRIPTQHLRTLTVGAVFEDDRRGHRGPAQPVVVPRRGLVVRPRLPMATHRAGGGVRRKLSQVGDDTGSAVVTTRLVRDVMRLGFLIEREYTPYSKWLGTAFARLRSGPDLIPHMQAALRAADWPAREPR